MSAEQVTRRSLLGAAALTVAGDAVWQVASAAAQERPASSDPGANARPAPRRPLVIASANGIPAVTRAMELLRGGGDPLDAVVAGVQILEDDPNDHTVGYGGLPNEDGVVELDASVMHGPTHKAGAVAALRNIRHPSRVAQLVMQRTDHVLLVGEGALRFARAHGFKDEDLLTDEARRIWLKWKESLSSEDDWLTPEDNAAPRAGAASSDAARNGANGAARGGATNSPGSGAARPAADRRSADRPHGTINCCAVTSNGDLVGVTTTSGLAYKIPGRVGDSPIIGAGLYVDNAVGAAGSTGRGEANLQNCSSFLVVELMRGGRSPEEACLEALQRIADRTEPRLRDKQGRPSFDLKLYALSKDGRCGSASIWSGGQYAVHDGSTAALRESAFLYRKGE